jgi:hypothetical protein
VFQADYEFKFVQEGSDKTTLMLPPVTYDSMEVAVFNIEMEVDSELHVSELEKEVTDSGTTKYILKIVKHILVPSEDVVDKEFGEDGYEIEYEDIADAAKGKGKKHKEMKTKTPMDAHNYSKPKIIVKSASEVKVEQVETKIENVKPKKSAVVTASQTVALDGTQIDNEDDQDGDDDDDGYDEYYNVDDEEDGDGDDDFEEMEIGENKTEPDSDARDSENDEPLTPKPKKKPAAKKRPAKKPAAKKEPQDSDRKKRKYDKTSHYSKESSNFTLERTETGRLSLLTGILCLPFICLLKSTGV